MSLLAAMIAIHATWTWPPGCAPGNSTLTDTARMSPIWWNIIVLHKVSSDVEPIRNW